MITLLIGHRGVGKSSLLERLRIYRPQALKLDLDQEIAEAEKKTIDQIFRDSGEEGFRKLETKYLKQILDRFINDSEVDLYLAVGAGFQGEFPPGVRVLWVRRENDLQGRIFLDRPRLNSSVSAFAEYLERAQPRHQRYGSAAHQELTLLEGFNQPYESEKEYFRNQIGGTGGVLTVLPSVFTHTAGLLRFFEQRLEWGVGLFELRDDLLSQEQIDWLFQHLPHERILISLRKDPKLHHIPSPTCQWDWPLEWGPAPEGLTPSICSLHQSRLSFVEALAELEKYPHSIHKVALEIDSFDKLLQGHQWMSESPKTRAFLPRSKDGRWRWYRLWMKNRMALNFWREGDGSSPDQPLLLEWLEHDFTTRWFAAILGDPVDQSWTPTYHADFFAQKGLPVLRIPISLEQWQQGALKVLEKLGLRFAAVTSPLKSQAYGVCAGVTENARKFQAVNTLKWTPQGWSGTNTDEAGLRSLMKFHMEKAIAVWGGGGTVAALHAVLPEAQFFAARTGQIRDSGAIQMSNWEPQVVVWAVGRSTMAQSQWPPEHWRPELVVDLNYAENSPGREYALRVGCEYRSGLEMFFKQADHQQEFWK